MRLIDADALPKYTGYALSADAVAKAVENAPTIEIVKCKDCYRAKEDKLYGGLWCGGHIRDAQWFCADGKRRDVK